MSQPLVCAAAPAWDNDLVHHSPTHAPTCRCLTCINVEIAALMRVKGGTPAERAARVERYHQLLVEYLDVRQGGARGREGEDDEVRAA